MSLNVETLNPSRLAESLHSLSGAYYDSEERDISSTDALRAILTSLRALCLRVVIRNQRARLWELITAINGFYMLGYMGAETK